MQKYMKFSLFNKLEKPQRKKEPISENEKRADEIMNGWQKSVSAKRKEYLTTEAREFNGIQILNLNVENIKKEAGKHYSEESDCPKIYNFKLEKNGHKINAINLKTYGYNTRHHNKHDIKSGQIEIDGKMLTKREIKVFWDENHSFIEDAWTNYFKNLENYKRHAVDAMEDEAAKFRVDESLK